LSKRSKHRLQRTLAATSAPAVQPTRTNDGWLNPVTGVGGPNDKLASFIHVGGDEWQWDTLRLANLYESDDIAARIVDAVVDEALRLGYDLEVPTEDPDLRERIADWQDAHDIRAKIALAEKWARLYGGSILLLGSDDGQLGQPLTYGGKLHFIEVYGKDEVTPARWYQDPLQPNFGKVSHYRISPLQSASRGLPLVHESRVIPFYGVRTTRVKSIQYQGWGGSVLIRALKPISQFHGSFASALAILGDANQNVYKIKGLNEQIKSGNLDLAQARLAVMDLYRSAVNAIALDADGEDFVRSTLSLSTGLSELLDKFALRIAAAARMPVTVLLGQSPAGLNATGESDRALWQAQAETEREQLLPAITQIYRVGFNAANGPTGGVEPKSWSINWPPLWVPTGKEEADIEAQRAATYRQYVDMGVLLPEHVAKAEFGSSTRQRPQLSEIDIASISLTHHVGTEVPDPGLAPANTVEPETEDDAIGTPELDAAEAPVDGGPAAVDAFAQQMTELQAERCPHGKANRCPMCGIERVRTVQLDKSGNHVWPVAWRRIGAPAPQVDESEAA
jgi:hypothetical protein